MKAKEYVATHEVVYIPQAKLVSDGNIESSITKSDIKHNYASWFGKPKYDCNVTIANPTARLKEGHIIAKVTKNGVVVAKFAARTGDVNTVVTKLKAKLDNYCNFTYVAVNPNYELYSSSWNNGIKELKTLNVKELVI